MTFEIAGNDTWQNNIIAGTYKVNQEPEYEEWTDANYKRHRMRLRTTVTGSFKMIIKTIEEYDNFSRFINSSKDRDNDTVRIKLTVNNLPDVYESDFFVDFSSTRDIGVNMADCVREFTVKVEEA